jgi:hypothetical protein
VLALQSLELFPRVDRDGGHEVRMQGRHCAAAGTRGLKLLAPFRRCQPNGKGAGYGKPMP